MTAVIVTGVDGSRTAMDAATTASRLAVALDADLVVVCAFDKLEVQQVEADGREYVFTTEGSARVVAEEAVRRLGGDFPGLRASGRGVQGKPSDALLQVADASGADLIVVGNRRVQGAARVLGSIATDVARKAHCDVYIAHTHARG